MQIIALVARGTRPPRLEEPFLSDAAWEVIQRCWVREPSQRPRMKDVTESMMDMSESASSSPLNYGMRREVSPTLSYTTMVRISSSGRTNFTNVFYPVSARYTNRECLSLLPSLDLGC